MKYAKSVLLLGIVPLILSGCVTVPDKSTMHRLNGEEARTLLSGNTFTRKTDYGRWASYYAADGTGVGEASGTWGAEIATFEYAIDANGEMCETYAGEHDWTAPGNEYCSVLYRDADGIHYYEKTKDTWKPNRVGNMVQFDVKPGNEYNLGG